MDIKKNSLMLVLLAASALPLNAGAEDQGLEDLLEIFRSQQLPSGLPFRNESGQSATLGASGRIKLTGPFFQSLGTNGRRCVSCHLPSAGWGITPALTRAVFDMTRGGTVDDGFGLGAIFRTNDGSNSPLADVSTLAARRRAYSQLLGKGLIRVGIGMPPAADFELIGVDDPYGYASANELSLFRRPLPSTNLKFLSTFMWDGRETAPGSDHCNIPSEGGKCFASAHFNLSSQANNATTGHAQGAPLTEAQRESILAFETALSTAQVRDDQAGRLDEAGAQGGPAGIAGQATYYGVNDNLGDYQTAAPFDPAAFTLYNGWASAPKASRAAVARGQALFNTRAITIAGVAGLNGAAGSPFNPPLPDSFVGSCTTCHNTPNAGNHSIVVPLNIGLTDASRRTPDMPLYTLRSKVTGAIVQTTDPGRALISGKFADIGKFKGPVLRGLAGRAPYFHNGFAKDLDAVVDFYNDRFGMGLSPQEHSDLVAFLRTL
jgi:hypothetical protein